MKKITTIFFKWTLTLLVVGGMVVSVSSCEDDPIVTPIDDDDDCTGSYCKLDNNHKDNTIALNTPAKKNPELY